MSSSLPVLLAVIGVYFKDGRTLYVRRSPKMKNYPSVWSLLSIQFTPGQLSDPENIEEVQMLMEQMSAERLGSARINTKRHLISDDSDANPINHHVFLHLYEIELEEPLRLNREFYSEVRWMTIEEYETEMTNMQCGSCMRIWGDYAYLHGIIDHPFRPV